MSEGRRTLVIGLDGMPPWLVEMLREEGALPHIGAVCDAGATGVMRSTVNTMTASAWPSMFTGVNPGRHGMFNFVQYAPKQHEIYLVNSLSRRAGAVWELLGADGRRSAILRVPMTFPATPMDGIVVGDQFAPSVRHPEFTWPRELRGELTRRFGLLGWGDKSDVHALTSAGELRQFLGDLFDGVARSFDLIEWALEREEFDFVFGVVSDTDMALHRLVPLLQPESTVMERIPEFIRSARGRLVDLFREVDRRIGAIAERLAADWNIVIVSDHGMGPNDPGAQLLRPILIELGYQGWMEPPAPPTAGPGLMPVVRKIKSAIAQRIPWQVRRLIDPISHERREAGARKYMTQVIDWERTRAFTVVPGGGVGELWLNTKERSPRGEVSEADREALVEELSSALLSVRDARTGEPQVDRIVRREDVVSGPHADLAPDLLIMFREDQDCVAVEIERPDGQTVRLDRSSTGAWGIEHYGYHQHDGLLIAAGPDIRTGDQPVRCDITDLAPTLAYLLGCAIPEGLDGTLVEGIIKPSLLEERPPVGGPPLPPPAWSQDRADYSDEDQAKVEKRLKDLGYI